MIRFAVNMLFLTLMLTACSKFSNRAQEIKMACGAELESAPRGQVFIKFDGADKLNVNLQQLQFASLTDNGQASSPMRLQISSKGCVVVPADLNGKFSVALPGSTFGAVVNTRSLAKDSINTIPLIKVEDPGFISNCPNDEIYANDKMTLPFQVKEQSSLELFAIKLMAESSTQPGRIAVFEKPLGETKLFAGSSEDAIDLSHLAEAEYALVLSIESVVPEIKSQLKLGSTQGGCKLKILRKKPKLDLSAYEGTGEYAVLPDSDLPINAKDSTNQVMFCRQKLDDASQQAKTACALDANCRDINDFKLFAGKIAEVPGRYRYIFLAADRAGNWSDPACLNLAVAAETEKLSLAWQETVLNEKNAFLPLPQLHFKPTIALLPSSELSEQDLESRLYCRVSFIADGRSTVKGEGVACTGGRCNGLRLDDYRPCDRDFSFSLADAWTQPFIQNSQLTLDVQLRLDGAGTTTRSIGFAINDSRWAVSRIAGPIQNNASNLSLLKLNENLLLIATVKQELILVSSTGKLKLIALPPPPPGRTLQRILLDNSNGPVDVALVYGSAQNFTTIFEELVGDQLRSKVGTPSIGADIVSCSSKKSMYVCLSSDSKQFVLYQGMWLADDGNGETGITMKRVLFHPSGHSIVANELGYRIFDDDPSADLGVTLAFEDSVAGRSTIDQITPDNDGSFWIYSTDGILASLAHVMRTDGSWTSVEFPALEVNSHILAGTQPFVKGKNNEILLFGKQFDSSQRKWVDVPGRGSLFSTSELIPNRDFNGRLWYRDRNMLWSPDEARSFIPASLFGLAPFQSVTAGADWGGTIFLAGLKSTPQQYGLFKFVTQPITAFSSDHASMPKESFPALWINSQGKPETTDLMNASTVALDQGVWKYSSSLPKGFTSSFAERYLPLKNDGLCQIAGLGLRCRYTANGEWKKLKEANGAEINLQWLQFVGQLNDGRVLILDNAPNSSSLLVFAEDQAVVRLDPAAIKLGDFKITDALIQGDIIYLAVASIDQATVGILGLSADFSTAKDLPVNLKDEFLKLRTSFAAVATSSGYYLLKDVKGPPLLCQTLFKDAGSMQASSTVCFKESQVALQLDAELPVSQQPLDDFAIDQRLKLAVTEKQSIACLLDLCFRQTQGKTTWDLIWSRAELAAFFDAEPIQNSQVQSLTTDAYGHVWIAVRNLGILRLD